MARRKRKSPSRRSSTRLRKALLTFLVAVFGVLTASGVEFYRRPESLPPSVARLSPWWKEDAAAATPEATVAPDLLVARVLRVVDGDTLLVEVEGREERVRLLNVDTPESVHPDDARNTTAGYRATEYTRSRLANSQVRLEVPQDRRTDNFGRTLAYVMVDGVNFNVELVREGYSPYYTKYGRSRRYDAAFREAEQAAKSSGKGVWSVAHRAEMDEPASRAGW